MRSVDAAITLLEGVDEPTEHMVALVLAQNHKGRYKAIAVSSQRTMNTFNRGGAYRADRQPRNIRHKLVK